MTTLTDQPPQKVTDIWMAALKLYGINRTASGYRDAAADPQVTEGLAARCGIAADEAGAELAAIGDAIAGFKAEGMTPEGAYNLAGLDRVYGPYLSEDAAVVIAAALLSAGNDPASLPDGTHPAVVDMALALAAAGVTPAEAAQIADLGTVPAPAAA